MLLLELAPIPNFPTDNKAITDNLPETTLSLSSFHVDDRGFALQVLGSRGWVDGGVVQIPSPAERYAVLYFYLFCVRKILDSIEYINLR